MDKLIVGRRRFDAYEKEPRTDIVKSDSQEITFAGRSTPAASGEVLGAGRTASFEDSDRQESVPLTRDLIKEIAMDIGKEVVAYVERMYPKAIESTASTFKLSLRNCIHNEIMAAIEVNDEGKIIERLEYRKKSRRWLKRMSKVKTMEEFDTVRKDTAAGSYRNGNY